MAWNDNLDGPALEIASTQHSPLRVLAGPGTGKTFALMRRMSRLLEQGGDPNRMLLVTFTRIAARDLERGIQALHITGAENIHKGTLHAFCYEMLNSAGVLPITNRVPRTLLDYEIKFLLQDLSRIGVGNYYERRRRLRAFEAAWATEQDRLPGWPADPTDQQFHRHLLDWLIYHRGMLVGELIPLSLNYLSSNPQSEYRAAFDHVLIDEYQDLNPAEQSLIDLLSESASLSIIGDADQSIYEQLRFAHPEGIISFPDSHPGTHSVPIQECRRCPELVVEIASSLIGNNQNRLGDLRLLPHPPNGRGDVSVVQWATMFDESLRLANYITVKVAAGEFNPGEVLVLCPRRQIGYAIRDALRGNNILAHSFFSEELLDGDPKNLAACVPQEALTLLNILADPNDLVSLRCWLGFGHGDLASQQYERIRTYSVENNLQIRSVLDQMAEGGIRIRFTDYLLERYKLLLRRIGEIGELDPIAAFDRIFPDGQPWAESFREFRDDFEEGDSMVRIIQKIRTNLSQPELPSDVDYVRIMSLQKSKGLTADHVIIASCIEGLIPPELDPADPAMVRNLEESRRLFYVALTRTRRSLVISSFASMPTNLAFQMRAVPAARGANVIRTITSRFIAELGPNAPAAIRGEDFIAAQIGQ